MSRMNRTSVLIPLTGFLQKNKVPIILTAVTILLYNLFPREELKSFILLGMLITIFTLYRYSPAIPIGYAILMLIVGAAFTSLKNEVLASQVVLLAYLLLIVGIICSIIELVIKGDALSESE